MRVYIACEACTLFALATSHSISPKQLFHVDLDAKHLQGIHFNAMCAPAAPAAPAAAAAAPPAGPPASKKYSKLMQNCMKIKTIQGQILCTISHKLPLLLLLLLLLPLLALQLAKK